MHYQLSFLQDNYFQHNKLPPWREIPYRDEPFVTAWEEYLEDIPQDGALYSLRKRLVQLSFPVQEGMSQNPEYLAATRKGLPVSGMQTATGCSLECPLELKVYLYQTMAGRLPVIETANRSDFETLVQVFSRRNEPVTLPLSMGACMVKGYNNWDRVARYKQQCKSSFSFEQMKAHKEVYQDTFLILNNTGYSGVPAPKLGLSEDHWHQLSMIIRREHEAAHYFTWRFLDSASNRLLDEFIADYMGIVAAVGHYRSDWFLYFMGLEDYPAYRCGGRLTNYLTNAEISREAFEELKYYIKKAAENVELFANSHPEVYTPQGRYEMLVRLSKTNLFSLVSGEANNILQTPI